MDTKGFKERFEALRNIEELLSVVAPRFRDPEVYYKELIEQADENLAEKRLRVLENIQAMDAEDEQKLAIDRMIRTRNRLLIDTDWTQLPDAPLDGKTKKYYRKYREYLRELPEFVRSNKLKCEVKTFDNWLAWVAEVKYKPGFEKFIP